MLIVLVGTPLPSTFRYWTVLQFDYVFPSESPGGSEKRCTRLCVIKIKKIWSTRLRIIKNKF